MKPFAGSALRLATFLALAGPLQGQPPRGGGGGSTAAAVGGGALGLYSGATMGLVGAIVPCTQTRAGATCVRASAMTGGVIGLAGGVLSGAADRGRIGDAAVSSSIGFLAGSAIGLVVKPIAQRVGWEDVFTLGLVGGAVGSQPRGAALGLAGGTVVGGLLWVVLREVEFPDALGFAVAGMALGVMGAWIKDGVNAQSGPSLVIPLQFRL